MTQRIREKIKSLEPTLEELEAGITDIKIDPFVVGDRVAGYTVSISYDSTLFRAHRDTEAEAMSTLMRRISNYELKKRIYSDQKFRTWREAQSYPHIPKTPVP